MSNATALINVLEMRKTLITELETYGVSAQRIYECLRTPYTDNTDDYLALESEWYTIVGNAIRYMELEDLNPDSTANVYFFSKGHGVCVLPMAELISHNSGYNGEKFTVRVEDFLSDVLQPLLNTAISDGDVPTIRSLTDAVVFVLTELQPQEQANG